MATFKVGQRVRFVNASTPEGVPYIGTQATITEIGEIEDFEGGFSDCAILHDDGEEGCVDFWQIEPIQDDGRKVVSWDALKDLWQPSHESTPA